MSDEKIALTAEIRSLIIERLCRLLYEHYVFPERVPAIEKALRQQIDTGGYDDYIDADVFCEIVTEHMYECCDDRHLILLSHAMVLSLYEDENLSHDAQRQAEEREVETLRNFGFRRVERLDGNIGYIDLRFFSSPEIAGDTAVAAMAFLAHTNALIIDLRHNTGGENYMAHMLTSYLVEAEPMLLNSFYLRLQQSTQQCWTLPYVPGKRYVNKPVYILTSHVTASAAEEFAYTLQQLKRATVIGERTMGAANPIEHYQITEHVTALIPIGKSINTVSGTNWEGTGVIPDEEIPEAQALQVAHLEAVQKTLADAHSRLSPFAYELVEKEVRMLIKDQMFSGER